MTATLAQVSKSAVLTATRGFLTSVLPSTVEVVSGLDNRVPEPTSLNYCVMTPVTILRLETNTTQYIDVFFEGSSSGSVLTVTNVAYGTIKAGQQLFGVDVLTGTFITEVLTGSGGVGTYTISKSQDIETQAFSSGYRVDKVPMQITCQVDIHGPDSFGNAQLVSGMWRSDWATEIVTITKGLQVYPLYCSEPRQMAFRNGEQQIEERWSIDLTMQVNNEIVIPQDYFSDADEVGLIPVDVFYLQ